MKKNCLLLLIAVVTTSLGVRAADSVKFTESYSERIVNRRYPDLPGEVFPEIVPTYTATLNATLLLPGLAAEPFTRDTTFSFQLGGLPFNGSGEDALPPRGVLNGNTATFYLYDDETDPEHPRRTGSITFKRAGNTLTITGSGEVGPEEGPTVTAILGEQADGEVGQTVLSTREVEFMVNVGDLQSEKALYAKVTRTARRGILDGTDVVLNTINVTGELDTVKPTLSILAPAGNARLTNDVIRLRGKTADNYVTPDVFVEVNGVSLPDSPEVSAGGLWTNELPGLVYGPNVVRTWAVDGAGNTSVVSVVRFVYTTPSVLHVAPPTNGTITGVRNGDKLDAARSYRVTAKPAKGYILQKWVLRSGASVYFDFTGNLTFDFVMRPDGATLEAVFIPNPFPAIAGSHAGLFHPQPEGDPGDPQVICDQPIGLITCTVSGAGVVSGQLKLGAFAADPGGVLNFSKPLDPAGDLSFTIHRRSPLRPLDLLLDFDLEDTNAPANITVSIDEASTGGALFRTTTTPGRCATNYTVTIYTDADGAPPGDGAGTMVIDRRGGATLTSTLSDGTVLNLTAPLTREGWIPVFAPLYSSKGWIGGWVACDPDAALGDHLYANLTWFKPPAVSRTDKYYTNGFCALTYVSGRQYTKPAGPALPFNWTNGFIAFQEGNLLQDQYTKFAITNNRVKFTVNTNTTTLIVTAATGLFNGTFKHPVTGKSVPFKGAILRYPLTTPAEGGSEAPPPGNVGYGWFLGPTKAGSIVLLPGEAREEE